MTSRQLLLVGLALVLAFALQPAARSAQALEPANRQSQGTDETHVVTTDTPYYTTSPAQARPPDGTFAKGTKLTLLRRAGSYVLVRSQTGIRAYMSAQAIRPLPNAQNPEGNETMTTELSSVVQGNNQFAVDLYSRLRGDGSTNLFFSAFSVRTALAMTYVGAAGDTAKQMADVLHFTLPESELNAAIARLQKTLIGDTDKNYQLRVANRLWGQKGYDFLPPFLKVTSQFYGAELGTVDFTDHAEQARQQINDWVQKQTEDKIKDLIQPGVLGPATRLVLTNAIYFKGDWQRKFDPRATRDAPFHAAEGDVTVPMMHQTARFGYRALDDMQVLELPYADNALSMVVLLPRKTDGLPDLEKRITHENLTQWTKDLAKQKVKVFLPRLKASSLFELEDVLQSMGMPLAFNRAKADFSLITTSEGLFISAVVHKAFVDVNEQGTEAAAATGIVMRATAAPLQPEEPPVFRADHPFVFLIRDNRTNAVLFMGRVVKPAD